MSSHLGPLYRADSLSGTEKTYADNFKKEDTQCCECNSSIAIKNYLYVWGCRNGKCLARAHSSCLCDRLSDQLKTTNSLAFGCRICATSILPDEQIRILMIELDDYKGQVKNLRFELKNAIKKIEELFGRCDILSAENAKLSAENAKLSAENAKLSTENAKLSAKNSKLSAENARLTEDNKTINIRLDKLSAENANINEVVRQLMDKIDKMGQSY